MLGGRPAGFVAKQILEPANYRALLAIGRVSPQPLRFARAYLTGAGDYPWRCPVRTPAGVITPTAYSHHDVITISEVFCRGDYELAPEGRFVLDIGSNIGISALYFLTRSPAVRVECYEPVARNAARLRENLAGYAGRYELHEEAVADREGTVSFGLEETGRYGAIGRDDGEVVEVRCRHINDVLAQTLAREPRIDLLKLDTEGFERATVAVIEREHLERIEAICFETREPLNPWPERFAMSFGAETCRLQAHQG